MVRHSQKGERPVISWKPGEIITPANGTVAYDEAQAVESYNVSCFVIQDAAWDAYWAGANKIPPAFASGRQVHLRPTIHDNDRGKVAPRELTHVMKQAGYQPYLDFVNRTLKQLDQKSVYIQQRLTDVANQKGNFLKPQMDRDDIVNWYDEFHASIYGEITANTTGKSRQVLDQGFKDFDAYATELTKLHRWFKARRNGTLIFAQEVNTNGENVQTDLRGSRQSTARADEKRQAGADCGDWRGGLREGVSSRGEGERGEAVHKSVINAEPQRKQKRTRNGSKSASTYM